MWLNDAFDADIDAIERPTRPIPSGRVSRRLVFVVGFGLLVVALLTSVVAGWLELVPNLGLALGAVGTALAVVAYDRFHKGFSWSPVLMGACRLGLFAMGALATTGRVQTEVLWLALALMGYVVGLTHVARFENGTTLARLWVLLALLAPTVVTLALGVPGILEVVFLALHVAWTAASLNLLRQKTKGVIGRVVVRLIAGISLLDAVFLSGSGALLPACGALLAFVATLGLQRWVKGT
jgi:4-hydroxybenzoate polyprenyltransferase